MKKQMKAVMVAAMVGSLLVGCGGQKTTESAGPESGSTSAESENPGAASSDGMVINVWHSMEGTNGEAFEAMVKSFNDTKGKELGITANSVFQGSDTAGKLKTLIQTDDVANMPDVCLLFSASLPVVAEYEGTVAVDDMYGKGTLELSKEDVNPSAVQTYSYKGKQMCMPFNSSTLLLYYNKDAFEEVGLDPAAPPKTLDEIADACAKLTVTEGGQVTRYGFNAVLDRYEMVNLVANQGEGTYFGDNESGRTGLITKLTCEEEIKNVFEAWDKISKTGGFKYTYDNQNEEFATGMNAMTLMSSARIGSVTKLTADSGLNWGVTYMPDVNPDDKGGACIGGASLAMFNNGDQPKADAAWEFIKFAASPETQSTWSQATGYLPINLKTKDLEDYKAFVEGSPAVALALEQFESSNPMVQEPVVMMQGSVDAVIKDASTYLCEGEMTAEEATGYVIEECNKLFEEYNRSNQ